jgi:hypothetical protein
MRSSHEIISLGRTWAARREPWLILLIVFAICCFGSYYRHSYNFRDEGGTVALIAKRLLEGQRPMVDVELGYNVMWYYPIVALFKVIGVNFVALRVYCFVLSTIAAVLGYLTVERVSRRPWFAFLVGVMLVLVPGMTFKNYMPLLVITNIWCLVSFILGRRAESESAADFAVAVPKPFRWGWLVFSSVILGLTYLIRIDLGMFFSALWIGMLLLRGLKPGLTPKDRVLAMVAAPILVVAIVGAVHAPVYIDARTREWDHKFVGQYTMWPLEIVRAVQQRFGGNAGAVPHVQFVDRPEKLPAADRRKSHEAQPEKLTTGEQKVEKPAPSPASKDVLKRKTWRDFFTAKKASDRWLVLLLYAPLLSILPLVGWSLFTLFRAWKAGDTVTFDRALAGLVVVGGALTAFPQYFFFRPDAPHLSEFSPGFWVGVCSALILLASTLERRRWPLLGRSLAALLVVHAAVFLWIMYPNRWNGTMAARDSRTRMLNAANGVNVYLTKREYEGMTSLLTVIEKHAKPGEYVVAYPYHPAVNLAVDRPTYEKNVYVDNAISSRNWSNQAIKRFQKFKPAVIVISEWDINGTDESRFSMWAGKAKTWVQTNYIYQGTYLEFEIYTRPEGQPP